MTIPIHHLHKIASNHIRSVGANATPEDLIHTIASKVQEGFKIVKFNDVLFAYHKTGTHLLLTIINGDAPKGYLGALRKFVDFMKRTNVKYMMMYVQDKASAYRIAESAGLQNISFKDSDQTQIDPYIMLAEVS